MKNLKIENDGWAKVNNTWIEPEEAKEIQNGNFLGYAKNRLEDFAKQNQVSSLNSYASYCQSISNALKMGIDFEVKLRNEIAKKHLTIKGYKSFFKLG